MDGSKRPLDPRENLVKCDDEKIDPKPYEAKSKWAIQFAKWRPLAMFILFDIILSFLDVITDCLTIFLHAR